MLFRQKIIFLLLILLTLSTVALAEDQVQIFQLEYRTAAEILKKIEPLLREGERISAAENNLIVIASPQTIEATNQLIGLLDHPLRQFLVQVRWIEGALKSSSQLGYDSHSGQSVIPGQGQTLGTSQRQSGQQLRVTEGEESFIATGQDIPYNSRLAVWSGQDSSGFASAISFQNVRSGFVVLINAGGENQLQVELTPQLMEAGEGTMLKPATLTLDRLSTRVRVVAGHWTSLAAFLSNNGTGFQILAGSEEPLPSGRQLQIRIDEQK